MAQITDPGIAELIDNYFEVMWHQDMSLFDKVFHSQCALYSTQAGELSLRPYAIYREGVANRVSPANTEGDVRRESVLMFDQISPTLALVKAELQMFGGRMNDYLNVVFLDGQWWVMAKMWERMGDATN